MEVSLCDGFEGWVELWRTASRAERLSSSSCHAMPHPTAVTPRPQHLMPYLAGVARAAAARQNDETACTQGTRLQGLK